MLENNEEELPIDEQINQFVQYLAFVHDDSERSYFPNGTVFYNVKDSGTNEIHRFGLTVKEGMPLLIHALDDDWDKSTFCGKPINIHLDEREYRDVFSGNISSNDLCNAILGGRIYVGPWEMRSVYNFGRSFDYARWEDFYEHQRACRQQEEKRKKDELRKLEKTAPTARGSKNNSAGSLAKATAASADSANPADSADSDALELIGLPSSFNFSIISKSSFAVLLAGAVANSFEALVMHPLDLLKTRFQLSSQRLHIVSHMRAITCESISSQHSVSPQSYNMLRLWRGSFPAVAMQAPRGALKFGVNTSSKKLLETSPYQHAIAGGITGVTESVAITPFELIKVRLQAPDKLSSYKNSYHALRTIVSKEGVFSLWRGLESTLWRNGSWNAAYFGCIDVVHSRVNTQLEFNTNCDVRNFIAGTIGGSLGACFSTPIDVAKSRIQNTVSMSSTSSTAGTLETSVPWTIPTVMKIGRHEGIVGLYRGFVPKLLRLGPGGGLLLVTFETTKRYLESGIFVNHE